MSAAFLLNAGDLIEGIGWVFFAAVGIFAVFALIGLPGRIRRRRLHSSTVFGEAFIHNVTAEYVNSSGPRYVRYDVTITTQGRAPYDAHASVLTAITEMPALNIGRTVPVQIDPKDPTHFRFVKN